jgi:small subunit ribosomal protein S15
LDKVKRTSLIQDYRLAEKDTGSTDVQVALLTERINQLTRHMVTSKHDFNTQRGLLKLVGQRRRLLNYLSKEDVDRYHKLITKLGLRK